ncbi:MAG: hypothetical protein ABEH43_02710 [Flavobacteriales bacterium]
MNYKKHLISGNLKQFIIGGLFSFLLICTGFLWNRESKCDGFYPMKEGTVLKYKNSNNNNSSTVKHKIKDVSGAGGKMKATMHQVMKDEEGKVKNESDLNMICEDGVIKVESNMAKKMMGNSNSQGGTIKVSGDMKVFPNSMSVGDKLEDFESKVTIDMGIKKMETKTRIYNRTVDKKEKIKTKAGKFSCYKITSDMKTDGMMGISNEGSLVKWVSKGVGLVKQKSLDKNGDVRSTMKLVEFKKP